MSSAHLLHPGSHLQRGQLVKTSVADVSRQHSSEVDSLSEAIPRGVLIDQLTVDKHRAMVLANAKF